MQVWWIFLVATSYCSVHGNFNFNSARSPVFQSLTIPAQRVLHQQDLHIKNNVEHISDVSVDAGKPFIIHLPSDTLVDKVILVYMIRCYCGKCFKKLKGLE